jgi:predicted DNA-binding transcriptional regulator YafY
MNRVIERILNLLAFLLTVERPVSADEIRHTVAGYDQETDEAFRRTFERDKDLLRQLGVPLRLEHTDAWEVEQGYVVAPDEYALADPGLTDEERAALFVAATMVRLGGQSAGSTAIFKLGGAPGAAGGEPLTADLGSEGEQLAELFEAVSSRRMLHFDYRGRARRVRPYGLAHRRGRWYLAGAEGDEVKVFRVDRMDGATAGETAGAFERPPGFDLRKALPTTPWTTGSDDLMAEVRFDQSAAWWAQRQLASDATIVEQPDGGVVATFAVTQPDALIGWVLSFEDEAEILGPPELRARLIEHIGGVS